MHICVYKKEYLLKKKEKKSKIYDGSFDKHCFKNKKIKIYMLLKSKIQAK